MSTSPPRPSARIGGPLRYYAPIQGHELVTRRDLIPSEPDHPRAGAWYYALQLGRLEHKLPPWSANVGCVSHIIITTGDRFMQVLETNDLLPTSVGRLTANVQKRAKPGTMAHVQVYSVGQGVSQ